MDLNKQNRAEDFLTFMCYCTLIVPPILKIVVANIFTRFERLVCRTLNDT